MISSWRGSVIDTDQTTEGAKDAKKEDSAKLSKEIGRDSNKKNSSKSISHMNFIV